MTYIPKWNLRFLRLAREVSTWSKDPSTGTGAVIVRPDNTVASLGYNGFPRRFPDLHTALHDREQKLAYTVHAEDNAILHAKESVEGYAMFVWPWPPCSDCAKRISQAGIAAVIAPEPDPEQIERWGDSFRRMEIMFRESNIRLTKVPRDAV